MSASTLLDALRKHELQGYYPSLSSQGLLKVDKLSELSEVDYLNIGVKNSEDKLKFFKLSKEIKNMMKNIGNNTNNVRPVTATPIRKRTSSVINTNKSPESNKKSRRMTIAPQTIIPKTNQPQKMSAFERRLSYMPSNRRESTYRSPTRINQTKLLSPQRQKTTNKLPASIEMDTSFAQQETSKETVEERAPARLLDAYGIPIGNQKTKTVSENNSVVQGSLEEFLLSKSKAATNSKSNVNVSSHYNSVQNELHQRIRVCVRKRPLNKREISNQETDIVPLVGARTIQLNAPKVKIDLSRYSESHTFTFDEAFDSQTPNSQIYARTAQPLVEYIFTGGKATCFAHGQTGSGKTYTMLDPEHGLYVLAANDIFRLLSLPRHANLSAFVGFYEIYQGQLFDLLNQKAKLVAREDGQGNVVIAGLREFPIKTVDDLLTVFEYGNQGRTVGKTGANNKSSRSHAVLQIVLKDKNKTGTDVHGKLSFIDLAGSERGVDRGDANMKTRLEGAEINKSLLALKECIRALDQNQFHTPFRGSKLTQVLRDSFTGNSRTCMIATISPNNSNSEHTLNTLRYADRVKQLRGESDPRLLNEESTKMLKKPKLEDRIEEDSQSMTNSDGFLLEDESENLLDVVIPNELDSNALATPTLDRFYQTTPHRQEKYLKRLESPPADEFDDHKIDDPFFSKPVPKFVTDEASPAPHFRNSILSSPLNPTYSPVKQEEVPSKPNGLDIARIKRFMRLHKAQIKEMEECMKSEKRMIDKLSLSISSSELRDEEDIDAIEDQQTKEEYENYLNDLEDIMDKKLSLVTAVSQKIKEELEE